jgi:hypothetical protein
MSIDEGQSVALMAVGRDPGSDDLTFTWSFGDGTPDASTIYYDNGVSPDPYPSPEVNPITMTDTATRMYSSVGTYTITLTVLDDDGGSTTMTLMIQIG